MEDTQKLTHLAHIELEEQQLLEDFFSGQNWDSQKQLAGPRCNRKSSASLEADRAA
jgi:hypothetical protein